MSQTNISLICAVLACAGCDYRDGSVTSTMLANELMSVCLTSQTLVAEVSPLNSDNTPVISNAFQKAFAEQHWERFRTTTDDSRVRCEMYHGPVFEAEVFMIPLDEESGLILIDGRSHDGSIRGFVDAAWRTKNSRIVITGVTFVNLPRVQT
ncbi:MAG: hypothetical protein JNL58_11470 [Planctomyces sp.]|nr:hypothetical protein [Planctomyces sp.]